MRVDRRVLLAVGLLTAVQVAGPRPGPPGASPEAAETVVAVLAIVQGVALWLWRHRPLHMLATVTAAAALTAIALPWVVPYLLFAALVQQARRQSFRRGALSGAAALGVIAVSYGVAFVLHDDLPADMGPTYLLLGAVALLGGLLLAARTAERQALRRRAAVEERLRIAYDLHDVVGHGLASIAVQSSTARMALGAGREREALAALAAVESVSRRTLAETRDLVAVLRDGGEPDLLELEQLLDSVTSPGLRVRFRVDGDARFVPEAVSRVAYRVVQESLTNVVRHSGARYADIRVRVSADEVRITVRDDGQPLRRSGGSGTGLAAMRQRVAALGGTVDAGPRSDAAAPGGWAVTAVLPIRGSRRTSHGTDPQVVG